MDTNLSELEQRLIVQEQAIDALLQQLDEREQFLDRVHADYSQLKLDHAALSDRAVGMRQQLEQAEQERDYLRQTLTRFEQDLRALQATRTVRATRLITQTLTKLAHFRALPLDNPSNQPNETPQSSVLSPQSSALSPYDDWIAATEPGADELEDQRHKAAQLAYRPLISVTTPVYNPPLDVLRATIEAVQAQTYDNWELCLADASDENSEARAFLTELAGQDPRIRVQFLTENGGIVGNSNAAIKLTEGEFCALLDHDDLLAPNALYEVALALNADPLLDLVYSDNDLLSEDGTRRFQPLFKPAWSPAIMLSACYMTHLTVLRTSLLREVGAYAPDTDAAQDWDLFLRMVEKGGRVGHIPKILYHWREAPHSTASNIYNKPKAPATMLRVIENHLRRSGLDATAFFDPSGFIRVGWPIEGQPKISIIIPTKDRLDLIRPCVQSILEKTTYPNFELLIVDTGSTDPAIAIYYRELAAEPRIKILEYGQKFNYSAVNNWATQQATGDFFLFLNNDTEVIAPDWLEEMVRWAQRPEVGPVGAKLLKRDGTIQHAGVIVGMGGYAGHIFAGQPEGLNTIFGYPEWYRDYSAVTAACMMLRRAVFEELGGFEEAFKLNGSDVDLCLRARTSGYRVIYNPFARLYHIESATHQGRVPFSDYQLSQERYRSLLESGDPYFNPNLSYTTATPTLKISLTPTPQSSVLSPQSAPPPSSLIPHPSSLPYDGWFWERYSLDAQLNAQLWDFSRADLEKSRAVMHDNPGPLEIRTLVWFLPPFQHAFYGGIHTILRFAAYFKANKGIENHFVIVRPQAVSLDTIRQSIGAAFPALQEAQVSAVENYIDLDKIEAADAVIATLWNTAYYALRFNRTRRKFYFVQDYEPLFYPAGTSYALAEAPYRFGFYGLTNTVSLRDIYRNDYAGLAEYFTPAVNTTIFHPAELDQTSETSPMIAQSSVPFLKPQSSVLSPQSAPPPSSLIPHPSSLIFYARPGAPRNAFELGTTALRRLKSRLGDRVRIVSAGADWQPEQYNLDGVIENLGLLSYEETAALYRTCEVGLVMMFTRHPSYLPFELMASGCLVVTNENAATSWFLRDGENCLLSAPSVSSLSETLELALTNSTLRAKIRSAALTEIRDMYSNWDDQIEKIYRFMGELEIRN